MLERRELIKKSVLWGSYALSAVALGYPVFSFISFRKITEHPVIFPSDAQHARANFREGVYLIPEADGFRALSAKCPHLGCTVNADPVSGGFKCPCHGSTFGPSGKWLSGPAGQSLHPLPVKSKPNGDIEIVIKI